MGEKCYLIKKARSTKYPHVLGNSVKLKKLGGNTAFCTGGYRFQGYKWFFSPCPRTSLPGAVPTVARDVWQTEPHLQHPPPSPTADPSI